MPLTQTSVSALTTFDPAQKGGCERRWWFGHVIGKGEQHASAAGGEAGHGLLAAYLSTGALPGKRVKMGKAVLGAIVKGDLPKPGPDLFVERRFDGGAKYLDECDACGEPEQLHGDPNPCTAFTPKWRPLDVANTLTLAGVPLDGFIDLSHARDLPTVVDHKFKADLTDGAQFPPELCEPGDLIKTIQMPVYAHAERRRWQSRIWRLAHHYVSRRGIVSKIVPAIVTTDQIDDRIAHVEKLIERMKPLADVTDQNDVPFNRRACAVWLGCPHQSTCRAFKENLMSTASLSDEEAALFDDLPSAPASAPAAEPDPLDEIAQMEAKLAKAKADAAAKKAEAEAKAKAAAEAAATAAKVKQPKMRIQDPDAAPAPAAQPETWPTCSDCGAQLNAQNASRLQLGGVKHIGCPKAAAPVPPPVDEKPKRGPGRPPKTEAPSDAKAAATGFLLDVIGDVSAPLLDRILAASALLK